MSFHCWPSRLWRRYPGAEAHQLFRPFHRSRAERVPVRGPGIFCMVSVAGFFRMRSWHCSAPILPRAGLKRGSPPSVPGIRAKIRSGAGSSGRPKLNNLILQAPISARTGFALQHRDQGGKEQYHPGKPERRRHVESARSGHRLIVFLANSEAKNRADPRLSPQIGPSLIALWLVTLSPLLGVCFLDDPSKECHGPTPEATPNMNNVAACW